MAERKVYTVSELSRELRELLEAAYGTLCLRGQITNLSRPQSGHLYFSLVDDEEAEGRSRVTSAQIPVVIWRSAAARLRFRPENGIKVVATGRLSLYEPRGSYQLIAERLEPQGVGELQLAFEQLKRALEREGLFARARKRPLPFLPRRIGIITSPSGAAVRDFLRIVFQRHPRAWVRIIPVRVQGEGAGAEIARALDRLQYPEPQVDVVVLARGGGSLEDLWAFNEEVVARAIARSRIPTISAIGHEVDFTIADFVADFRAPTPTGAGECVIPDLAEIHLKLDGLKRRLVLALRSRVDGLGRDLLRLGRALPLRDPQIIVNERLERLDQLSELLQNKLYNRLRQWDDSLFLFAARLEGLNPFAVLARGYSVTTVRGRVVRKAMELKSGDLVAIRFTDGQAQALVEGVIERAPSARPGLPGQALPGAAREEAVEKDGNGRRL
jgi:exodeoxyribonuclease VII large subunit